MHPLLRKCRSKSCRNTPEGEFCKHKSERFELPREGEGSHGRWQTPVDPTQLENNPEEVVAFQEHVQALMVKLAHFGLTEWEIQVVIERDIGNFTYAEICEEHGYTSEEAAKGIYNTAVEKAKRGYLSTQGSS